nr:MAG TPA: hypothetical protein [Caudoviricetes sp.]
MLPIKASGLLHSFYIHNIITTKEVMPASP